MKQTYGECALRIAVGIIMLGLLLAGSANAATLTVCKSGCIHSSIQDAINASSSGDTIQVQNGTYYENVNVTKQLTLRGIGMPVVDANSPVTLSADGITLEGFTVIGRRSGNFPDFPESFPESSIKVTSNNNMLSSNNASKNYYGIYLGYSSNNTLIGNVASNNGEGISLDSSNNNTLIGNNAGSNNRYIGISLNSSSNNTLIGNNALNNHYDSISLSGSSGNTLIGNNASNSLRGISLSGSSNNTLIGNNASNNIYGISLSGSSNNKIYHNNLIDNTNQAMDNTNANSWHSGYPTGGNYWSDYTGTDIKSGLNQDQPGSDSIGDTPYNISGSVGVQDRYPFMIMNGWISFPPKGDLNSNGITADAGDLVLMKRASIGEIPADSRYDLNNNGQFADAGDLVLMKRASIGEINL